MKNKKIFFFTIFFVIFFANVTSAEYSGAPINVPELEENAGYSFFIKIDLGEKYLNFYPGQPEEGFWLILNSNNCVPIQIPIGGPKLKTTTGLQRSQTENDGSKSFNFEMKIMALDGGHFGIPNNELIVEFRPVNFLPVKVEVSYLPMNFQDNNPQLKVQCLKNLDGDGQYDEINWSEANQIRNNLMDLLNSMIVSKKVSIKTVIQNLKTLTQ